MQSYKCVPQAGFAQSLQFHLSWVLLCLEGGMHNFKQQLYERQQLNPNSPSIQLPNLLPFGEQCQHEMLQHREMMVQEFKMSPEMVMSCAQVGLIYLINNFKRKNKIEAKNLSLEAAFKKLQNKFKNFLTKNFFSQLINTYPFSSVSLYVFKV